MNTKTLVRIPLAGILAALITALLFQQLARLTAPIEFVSLPKTMPIDIAPHTIDSPPPEKKHIEKLKQPVLEKTVGVPGIGISEEKANRVPSVSFDRSTDTGIGSLIKKDSPIALGGDRSSVPVFRKDPTYPSYAEKHNIEGWVRVRFDITATGAVSNAQAVAAEPQNVFEDSALKAIASWRYKPQIEDGIAVEQRGVETVIRFQLK